MPTTRTKARRQRNQPDTRPDWRDPNMPVWVATGRCPTGEYIPSIIWHCEALRAMNQDASGYNYRLDPTYFWNKRSP